MKRMAVPVENLAEIVWGILLLGYLIGSRNPDLYKPIVLVVFSLSGSAALVELYLRRMNWPSLLAYDTIVWSLLLSAMVVVTGGRGSEVWPAYILMSLTAPSVDSRAYAYVLLAGNSLFYALIYCYHNPFGVAFQPSLLGMRIGLFFLVAYVVDRSMMREREANAAALAVAQTRVTELTEARDAERRRVATDLHDWLGSGIYTPMRKLELAVRAPSAEEARAHVAEAVQILSHSQTELRRVMEDLHPHLLEQLGVIGALESYLSQWGEAHGIATQFTVQPGPEPANTLAITLFRVLQEALNNCAKHAEARLVQVELLLQPERIHLAITDNGKGFDRPSISGRGLSGMYDRASVCGGTVRIQSNPGVGTRVELDLPHRDGERIPLGMN
jgi:signal transduction histidine kinase